MKAEKLEKKVYLVGDTVICISEEFGISCYMDPIAVEKAWQAYAASMVPPAFSDEELYKDK